MFNEDARVKIPTVLHLCRLGYTYLSLKEAHWDKETNVFPEIFERSLARINPGLESVAIRRYFGDLSLMLENEDLGREFFEKLKQQTGIKLIDFSNFDNNSFHVVTELPCERDDESFRPDITLLINGMPLAFIEVKKPNNREGILAERKRIYTRFENKKFRKFINITQLMVFSNNMEYDDDDFEPLQGAYYATPSYNRPGFNFFREEDDAYKSPVLPEIDDDLENEILRDNNLTSIKGSHEFATNKKPNAPTNRICTSLFSKERFAFMLRYSIAYVEEVNGLQKHVMRYPQIFATKAIENKLDEGVKKGIIWHTQGSGKTALAFYNVHHLTDYFQKQGVVPKFYFIVDRLDLLTQAAAEFEARGLRVRKVNSKSEFAREIKSTLAVQNDRGQREITVVNIQKFKDDPDVIRNADYNLGIQRIYFLDEVHRSYNPKGSFLANLKESDPNAIKIGLTGTPLLGSDFNSRDLFGDYIHKYYYNASIRDGYTLRLIREEIETTYKLLLKETLEAIPVLRGEGNKKELFAHPKYAEALLKYIVADFEESRLLLDDNTIGAMVVCDSSEQAKTMYDIFQEKYAELTQPLLMAADPDAVYKAKIEEKRRVKSAALILHDVDTKSFRKERVDDFKAGKIDLIFVYNMLLTGFDAPRLKKLYLGRVVKSHNLLQALTRVNRTYKNFKYGYVVDFADIQSEFDKTNRAYFDELQAELGDELQHYSDLFLSMEEIEAQIAYIEDALLHFETANAEIFSQQVSEINDRKTMLDLVKALDTARSLYNLIRLTGNYELLEKLDFKKLTQLARVAEDRLALINQKAQLESGEATAQLLNVALEDVIFAFAKVSEGEMVLADELKDMLRKTRESLAGNFDQRSPEFISLKEELERLFKKKNLNEVSQEEMEANIEALNSIFERAKEDDRKNRLLRAKYANDAKYARIHKRLMELGEPTKAEGLLLAALNDLKQAADAHILQNARMLNNEDFVERMLMKVVLEQFETKHQIKLTAETTRMINKLVVNEYINEHNGAAA